MSRNNGITWNHVPYQSGDAIRLKIATLGNTSNAFQALNANINSGLDRLIDRYDLIDAKNKASNTQLAINQLHQVNNLSDYEKLRNSNTTNLATLGNLKGGINEEAYNNAQAQWLQGVNNRFVTEDALKLSNPDTANAYKQILASVATNNPQDAVNILGKSSADFPISTFPSVANAVGVGLANQVQEQRFNQAQQQANEDRIHAQRMQLLSQQNNQANAAIAIQGQSLQILNGLGFRNMQEMQAALAGNDETAKYRAEQASNQLTQLASVAQNLADNTGLTFGNNNNSVNNISNNQALLPANPTSLNSQQQNGIAQINTGRRQETVEVLNNINLNPQQRARELESINNKYNTIVQEYLNQTQNPNDNSNVDELLKRASDATGTSTYNAVNQQTSAHAIQLFGGKSPYGENIGQLDKNNPVLQSQNAVFNAMPLQERQRRLGIYNEYVNTYQNAIDTKLDEKFNVKAGTGVNIPIRQLMQGELPAEYSQVQSRFNTLMSQGREEEAKQLVRQTLFKEDTELFDALPNSLNLSFSNDAAQSVINSWKNNKGMSETFNMAARATQLLRQEAGGALASTGRNNQNADTLKVILGQLSNINSAKYKEYETAMTEANNLKQAVDPKVINDIFFGNNKVSNTPVKNSNSPTQGLIARAEASRNKETSIENRYPSYNNITKVLNQADKNYVPTPTSRTLAQGIQSSTKKNKSVTLDISAREWAALNASTNRQDIAILKKLQRRMSQGLITLNLK